MSMVKKIAASSGVVWLLAICCATAVGVLSLWWGALNQDEGWYLYAARLVSEGKLPYRDFFFTQGPALPFVYSFLAKCWAPGSPVSGILGGRLVTFLIGLLQTGLAVLLVRRLVPPDRRGPAGLCVFALLACNLYHVYFTTIPKTYALGGLFLTAGFYTLSVTLGLGRALRAVGAFASGVLLAFASGTRISLVLVLGAVGLVLLAGFRRFGWTFVFFGLGGLLGLALTYGIFAADPASLRGLLAAQKYHAARGGFDPFFAIGSVSRLARGYAATGLALFLLTWRSHSEDGASSARAEASWVFAMLIASFTAVFLLQLSAPFPYDDYQVPIMPLLAVAIIVKAKPGPGFARVVTLAACLCSFASPQLQEWATYGQDRFWSVKKETTELAKLRATARTIEELDPAGDDILTQDLYLAVETGRHVPSGLEMGPFCYFADATDEEARALNVMNTRRFEELIDAAPCRIAAFSGYGFAISVPKTAEVPFDRQTHFWERLKKRYGLVAAEYRFGQNATTLLVLKRKDGQP